MLESVYRAPFPCCGMRHIGDRISLSRRIYLDEADGRGQGSWPPSQKYSTLYSGEAAILCRAHSGTCVIFSGDYILPLSPPIALTLLRHPFFSTNVSLGASYTAYRTCYDSVIHYFILLSLWDIWQAAQPL